MRNYETMYILKPELEQELTASLVAKYQTLVTEHGGTIDQVQEMGKRRLAYEINDNRDGFYVLMHYTAGTDVTQELERVMRIDDNVLRYLTVRKGE